MVADGAAPQLLKPGPCGTVAAKAKQLFQVDRIDPGFSGGEPPHGFEPISDRLFGAVHDRIGGQRILELAVPADVQLSQTEPIVVMTASFALKAVWPLELEQILVTGIRIGEPGIEFDFGSWEIFGDGEVCHGGLLFGWF